MNRILLLVLIFVLSAFSFELFACSMAPTSKPFEVTGEGSIQPVTPTFELDRIKRGTNDSNHASCSDAASIVLKLKNLPNVEQGYIFELADGKFEDTLFSANAITISDYLEEKNKFYFVWFDGNSVEQEAFDITLKITAVSKSGIRSESQFLKIFHPGVKNQ